MKMFDKFVNGFDRLGGAIRKNKATVFTVIGMAGVAVTTYQTVKSTMEVQKIVKGKKPETKKELAKAIWKPVVKTAIPFIATEAAIFMSNRTNKKTIAALQMAAVMFNADRKAMRDKVMEKMGKTKGKQLLSEVAQEREKNADSREVFITGHGDDLCFDVLSGRYFRSSQMHIEKTILDMDKAINEGGEFDINDVWGELGLPVTPLGGMFGWSSNGGLTNYIGAPGYITHGMSDKFAEKCIFVDLIPNLEGDSDAYYGNTARFQ